MSLEKSVLTEPIISNLLSTHYGIFPLSVNKLKLVFRYMTAVNTIS